MDGDADGDGGERDGWIRSGGKKIIVHIVVYHLHIHTYIIQDAVGTLSGRRVVSRAVDVIGLQSQLCACERDETKPS